MDAEFTLSNAGLICNGKVGSSDSEVRRYDLKNTRAGGTLALPRRAVQDIILGLTLITPDKLGLFRDFSCVVLTVGPSCGYQ